MNLNQQLELLSEKMAEHKKLKSEVTSLEKQLQQLSNKLRELENIRQREQADVDKLEKTTLTSIYYWLVGQKEDVLYRERADVQAAALKCEAARREIEDVEREIALRRKKLSDLSGCEYQYQELMRQKRAQMNDPEVEQLENSANHYRQQQKEMREAISAGRSALHTAENILGSLKSADGFATWDLLGGGMIADMAKHSRLNEAQRQIELLQRQLRQFKTELCDVDFKQDVQLNVDGFLYVADFIFDGLIADWMVKDRIGRARQQVENTRWQIEKMIARLQEMEREAARQEDYARMQLEEKIQRG